MADGFESLRATINMLSKGNIKRDIYLARVVQVVPELIIRNAYFEIKGNQLDILYNTKIFLNGKETDYRIGGEHRHLHITRMPELKVNDELLILLYEQEEEQKFILIDKVISYE